MCMKGVKMGWLTGRRMQRGERNRVGRKEGGSVA